MVSFSSTSVGSSFELCHGHTPEPEVQGGQVGTPGPPRVLGQAADDFPRTCSLASFWP